MEALTHLDTHVVIWLKGTTDGQISPAGLAAIESDVLRVSPMVRLELTYLRETNRLRHEPEVLLNDLERSIDLREADEPFGTVVAAAQSLSWTRDPFDRMISAQAIVAGARLLTKDDTIRDHLDLAFW